MKIAIDARGVNLYKGTGIGTYTDNILKNMISNFQENFYTIFWTGGDYDTLNQSNTKIIISSKRHHNFFEQCYFPGTLSKEACDIYHIPQNGVGISENISCKKIVTIHDLIPYIMPETVGKGYLNKFLKDMPKIVELADSIITVSEYSKKDILKFFNIDENKVFVTPLAADKKYKPLNKKRCKMFLEENYGIKSPFILYIGGFSPRKNVKSLIIAFSKIYKKLPKDFNLVIVGDNRDSANFLKSLSCDLYIEQHIKFTGFVPENHLPIFYNSCEVFAYPSLYEGFGLPPLEAMNCGTAVITSNLSSIPEVVGDGGILIDPHSTEELMTSLESVLNDSKFQENLARKALNRASLFSWNNTVEKTIKSYEKTLSMQ